MVHFSGGAIIEKQGDAFSWRDDVFPFSPYSPSEAVSRTGRYTNTTIESSTWVLCEPKMGVRFQVGSLDTVFHVLEIGFDVKSNYSNDCHIQLSVLSSE